MADLTSLRSHSGFPGTLLAVLEDHEKRLAALEAQALRAQPAVEDWEHYNAAKASKIDAASENVSESGN